MISILVTGGTGFIGSHTCLLLLQRGFKLYIIDSEINSCKNVLNKISFLLKFKDEDFKNKINFFHGDIRDIFFVEKVFFTASKKNEPIESVFHFAGLKSVFESIKYPIFTSRLYIIDILFNFSFQPEALFISSFLFRFILVIFSVKDGLRLLSYVELLNSFAI